jgi:hypothetical protein
MGIHIIFFPLTYPNHILPESRTISRYILKKYKSDLLPEDDLKKATMVDVDVEYGQYNPLASVIIKNVMGCVGFYFFILDLFVLFFSD